MKTYGQLWDQITCCENIFSAWLNVRAGRTQKPAILAYERRLEEHLSEIQQELREGRYHPSPYFNFRIMDPKPRMISCSPLKDRIVHHALCDVIAPLMEKHYITHTYACRMGYGSHLATAHAQTYARKYRFFLKIDIHHYFDSIDPDLLTDVISARFREKEVRELISVILHEGRSACNGLPIGNLTSQWFANTFLDEFDHMWQRKGLAYLRYMDDMLFLSNSKKELWAILDGSRKWLKEVRNLELKESATRLSTVQDGIPFLGFRIKPTSWRLKRARCIHTRKHLKEREVQFLQGEITPRQLTDTLISLEGSLRWYGLKNVLEGCTLPHLKRACLINSQGASEDTAASGSYRVNRGGNSNNASGNCSSVYRNYNDASNRNWNIGVRFALSLPVSASVGLPAVGSGGAAVGVSSGLSAVAFAKVSRMLNKHNWELNSACPFAHETLCATNKFCVPSLSKMIPFEFFSQRRGHLSCDFEG